ncbi:unnamed protein product, partial [Phaeothamnion confervicola]
VVLFSLTPAPRFALSHAFNARLLNLYKSLPSADRVYDGTTSQWHFPWPKLDTIVAQIKALGFTVVPLPHFLRILMNSAYLRAIVADGCSARGGGSQGTPAPYSANFSSLMAAATAAAEKGAATAAVAVAAAGAAAAGAAARPAATAVGLAAGAAAFPGVAAVTGGDGGRGGSGDIVDLSQEDGDPEPAVSGGVGVGGGGTESAATSPSICSGGSGAGGSGGGGSDSGGGDGGGGSRSGDVSGGDGASAANSAASSAAAAAGPAAAAASAPLPPRPMSAVETEVERQFAAIPARLREGLYPFQREGVQFGLRRGGRVLIGDEMGCGKTLQGAALAAAYRSEWPLLVICPGSLKKGWAAEMLKWLPGLNPRDVNDLKDTGKAELSRGAVVIVSYDLVPRLVDNGLLHAGQFRVIIADESHKLKTQSAKRTKAILPLLWQATRTILLSGTPALSRPVELFTQLSALLPDVFKDLYPFAERYCNLRQTPFGPDMRGASNEKELKMILETTVMIRRLKEEVLAKELGGKKRDIIIVPVEAKYRSEIDAFLRQQNEIERQITGGTNSDEMAGMEGQKRGVFSKLAKATGLGKLKGAIEHILELCEGDEAEDPDNASDGKAIFSDTDDGDDDYNGRGSGDGRGGRGGGYSGGRGASSDDDGTRTPSGSDSDGESDGENEEEFDAGEDDMAWAGGAKGKRRRGGSGDGDDKRSGKGKGKDTAGGGGSGSTTKRRRLFHSNSEPAMAGPASGPAGAKAASDAPMWTCPMCTLENDAESSRCEACSETRPQTAAPPAVSVVDGRSDDDDDGGDNGGGSLANSQVDTASQRQGWGCLGRAGKAASAAASNGKAASAAASNGKAANAAASNGKGPARSGGGGKRRRGRKVVVFGHHKEVLDGIAAALRQREVIFERIDGETAMHKRQPIVDRFQHDPDVQVCLLGISAA